jgi:hypothetical protein
MIFIKIWIWFLCISLSLIPFRTDARLLIMEILTMLFSHKLIGFIFSATILFIFLPFTVPHSINNIINKNKK